MFADSMHQQFKAVEYLPHEIRMESILWMPKSSGVIGGNAHAKSKKNRRTWKKINAIHNWFNYKIHVLMNQHISIYFKCFKQIDCRLSIANKRFIISAFNSMRLNVLFCGSCPYEQFVLRQLTHCWFFSIHFGDIFSRRSRFQHTKLMPPTK